MKLSPWVVWALANVCVATLWGNATEVRAEAPGYLPLQGYLSDAQGTPVNGSVSITFRLYDNATDGTKLFEETLPVVKVDAGYFTVYLGESKTLDLSLFRDRAIVFVGILVSGDSAELSPRLQLATAPYAAYAEYAGDAASVGGKPASAFLASDAKIPWTSITGLGADCGNGQYAYGLNSDGTLKCRADVDTNTAYARGPGVQIVGNQIGLQCQWEFKGSDPCGTNTICDLNCASPTATAIAGGCDGTPTTQIAESYPKVKDGNFKGNQTGPYPVGTTPSDPNVPFIDGWHCRATTGGRFDVIYALCCEI